MFTSALYRRSPAWLQETLIAGRAWGRTRLREGTRFRADVAELDASQRYGAGQLAALGTARLGAVLERAATYSPFYRERFRAAGLDPAASAGPAELARLPLLDKATVRAAGATILANPEGRRLTRGGTSGTTGAPLTVYQDLAAITREHAFASRQLAWAGLPHGRRRAWLRGDLVAPLDQRDPPFWRRNRAENMLMLSAYHLAERHAAAYLDALARFDPVVIQAYPSAIGFLAGWLAAAGRSYAGTALRGIVTSSETLGADQRRAIEAGFGCRVFDWYGQFERVAAIGTCEHGGLHVLSDYAWVEFLPADDGLHEIVGTGFNNRVMPLIRYRTGDRVELPADDTPCACGRAFPLVKAVHGRVDDAVRLPDGRTIGRLDHVFKGVDGIVEAQIRQEVPDRIDILVVPGPGYGPAIADRLRANAGERLGTGVTVAVREVGQIPRTANGKFRGVVCTLQA